MLEYVIRHQYSIKLSRKKIEKTGKRPAKYCFFGPFKLVNGHIIDWKIDQKFFTKDVRDGMNLKFTKNIAHHGFLSETRALRQF